MKIIPLTQGKRAIVDDEDYEYISQWKWHLDNGYAARSQRYKDKPRTTLRMHRVIMDAPKGMEIDHINQDKLDNRKANLRFCTRRENQRNMPKRSNNKSGYIGVSWNKSDKKWLAHANDDEGRYVYLGTHASAKDAAKVRDEYVREHYGEFAVLNS